MKSVYFGLTTFLISCASFAASDAFTLEKEIRPPYQECTKEADEARVLTVQQDMVQDARLKCQSNVTQLAAFKTLRNECGLEGLRQRAIVRIQSEFVCNTPTEKIIGVGYKIERAGVINTGLSVFEIADSDAIGQCGSDVVRISSYSYKGQDAFTRTYYKYGRVRFMTSAEYECVQN